MNVFAQGSRFPLAAPLSCGHDGNGSCSDAWHNVHDVKLIGDGQGSGSGIMMLYIP